MPTATLEMSSKRRLATLWKAVTSLSGKRDPDRPDELVASTHALPVAGEVLRQGHQPLAGRTVEHDRGLEREEGRGEVADGGAGGEVAAHRRRVADEGGRELGKDRVEQRDAAGEVALELGEGERGAELEVGRAAGQGPQLLEVADADDERGPAPRRLTSTPQSVEPATRTASGCSRSSCSTSARSAART